MISTVVGTGRGQRHRGDSPRTSRGWQPAGISLPREWVVGGTPFLPPWALTFCNSLHCSYFRRRQEHAQGWLEEAQARVSVPSS